MVDEASWRTQHLHRVPLPEGCKLLEPPEGALMRWDSLISWAPGSTHCCLALQAPASSATEEPTLSLLVLNLGTGAHELRPVAHMQTGSGALCSADVHVTIAGVSERPRVACITRQQARPPSHALLSGTDVELVHISHRKALPGSAIWAPNVAAVCVQLSGPNAKLLLCEVGNTPKAIHLLAPEMPSSAHFVWAPSSQQLLLVGGEKGNPGTLSAAFVSTSGEVHQQQTAIPRCLSSVVWGSAGLVAIACHVPKEGLGALGSFGHTGKVFLCSVSEGPPALQILRLISTGACITSLCFGPCGLLAAWVDHGSNMAWTYTGLFTAQAASGFEVHLT